jgi:hypothetical protein
MVHIIITNVKIDRSYFNIGSRCFGILRPDFYFDFWDDFFATNFANWHELFFATD